MLAPGGQSTRPQAVSLLMDMPKAPSPAKPTTGVFGLRFFHRGVLEKNNRKARTCQEADTCVQSQTLETCCRSRNCFRYLMKMQWHQGSLEMIEYHGAHGAPSRRTQRSPVRTNPSAGTPAQCAKVPARVNGAPAVYAQAAARIEFRVSN